MLADLLAIATISHLRDGGIPVVYVCTCVRMYVPICVRACIGTYIGILFGVGLWSSSAFLTLRTGPKIDVHAKQMAGILGIAVV